MNRVILIGRLARDPEIRYSQGEHSMAIARYTLAVDRRDRRNQNSSTEQQTADFISCAAFNRVAEFTEKYFRRRMRVLVSGRIQTSGHVNKEGQKVYTTEIILDDQEFTDGKGATSEVGGYAQAAPSQRPAPASAIGDGLMNIPDGVEDKGLPFNQDVPWLIVKEDNTSGVQ